STYDHRTLKTRLPVRSALFKQRTGGLVVRWVTTSESPLLYVYLFGVIPQFLPAWATKALGPMGPSIVSSLLCVFASMLHSPTFLFCSHTRRYAAKVVFLYALVHPSVGGYCHPIDLPRGPSVEGLLREVKSEGKQVLGVIVL
ncbi:hypothetical protein P153DRAFT_292170, partial [Dothidotthia symphoricarpi CBS 119687]